MMGTITLHGFHGTKDLEAVKLCAHNTLYARVAPQDVPYVEAEVAGYCRQADCSCGGPVDVVRAGPGGEDLLIGLTCIAA